MGEIIRSYPWSATPLGAVHTWPQSFRSVLSICLNSNFPIAVYWGADLTLLYNDAWSPIPGNKHPRALGRPAKEVWPEIWDAIEPQFQKAFQGQPGGSKDALLPMQRHGYTEECYFDFTFTPVYGEGGTVEGVFNAVIETTYSVINERRTAFLKDFAINIAEAKATKELFAQAVNFIQSAAEDIPFASLYTVTDGEPVLYASTGDVHPFQRKSWPFAEAVQTGKPFHLTALNDYLTAVPKNFWPEEPTEGCLIPIGHPTAVKAFLVCGLSARRRFDEAYRSFIEAVGSTVNSVFNTIASLEEERKKAEALAEVDRAKTAFFTNISHEFRTPLTLMLGSLEGLLNGQKAKLEKEEAAAVEAAHRNATRLLRLVNNLLDFSRLEAGRIKAVHQLTGIGAFTADLAAAFRSAIEAAGLQFRVLCEDVAQPVYVDREMWEKIVLNLLSNAFKYTLKGGITISLAAQGDDVILKVTDTGVGIPAAELPKMFQRFHRVQNATGRTFEGTGIGLSLVKELVGLHGGEITVRSEVDRGTEFTVIIPAGKARLNEEQETEDDAAAYENTAAPFLEEAASLARQPSADAERPVKEASPTVMVVDDNADMRRYMTNLLQERFNVATASNGAEALQKIEAHRPALVVSDIMMPVVDGVELLKTIKQTPQTAALPVILVSARAGEEARIEGFETGADDYLVKPFSAKELLARVSSQISLAKKRSEALQSVYRLFDGVPFAVAALKGPSLLIEYINQYNLDIWQCKKEEVLGKPLFDARPDMYRSAGPIHADVYRTGHRFEAKEVCIEMLVKGKEETRYFHVIIDPMRDEEGRMVGQLATSIDITTQVLARKEIEESESRFRTLAETLPQMIWVSDSKRQNEYYSKEWFDYCGIADVTAAWAYMIHPQDRQMAAEAYRKAFEQGIPFRTEVRLKNKAGEFRWHSSIAEPVRDGAGNVVKWIGAITDIHDQKTLTEKLEAEVAERTRELKRSNEDLQQFAHVASHDLKEPVRKVRTFSSRLMQEFGTAVPEKGKLYLSKIETAAERMYAMIDGVLAYSSLNAVQGAEEPVNLNNLLQQIETDLEIPVQQKAAVISYQDLPDVSGSSILLYQLFYNLINNSLKFSKSGVAPVIAVDACDAAPKDVSERKLEPDKAWLKITVRDNGIGFDEDEAGHIFGTFTRLHSKDKYEGTGLGLALCRKIAERHGGAIEAEGREGEGAVFTVWLPRE